MDERRTNEEAIAERVRELAASYGIEVKQVSYRPMSVSVDRKMEMIVFLDTGDNERPYEVKILVEDVDDYQSGSDVRMRVDRRIESVLGAILPKS